MPRKVLIVDDAVFMRGLIKDVFSSPEYEIVGEATNGIEGVEKFKELKPDIIIMDIVMPFKSGIEAAREIRQLSGSVIIIMCSALGQETLVMEAIEAGANDFIVKPFKKDEVMAVVSKFIK
ncbi:MAG: response regulator [Deltaproteobacteria bacterium]|nr:response regulator [Deltaproteobacteria bacterium]